MEPQWRHFLTLARPSQWIKNLFVLAPLVFSGAFLSPTLVGRALVAFVIFCIASSAMYSMNDVFDVRADRAHSCKKHRPVASGVLSARYAVSFSIILSLLSLFFAWFLSKVVFVLVAAYFLLNIWYSFSARRIPIADIFVIALGFVVRVAVGIAVVYAPYSPWILSAAFFIALCLAAGKRRTELRSASEAVRASRANYAPEFLNVFVAVSAATTLSVFAAYAFLEAQSPWFALTVVPVAFGMSRFLFAVLTDTADTDDPTTLLLRDPYILASVSVFVALSLALNS